MPVTDQLRARVWGDFTEQIPYPDKVESWIDEEADALKVPRQQVAKAIRDESRRMMSDVRRSYVTEAQRAGEMLGVTVFAVMNVVNAGLMATKQRLLLDSKGRPKKDADGQAIVWETPDWQSRRAFAELGMKLLDAFPAQQIDVTHQHLHLDLTHDDALRRLGELQTSVTRLRDAIAGASNGAGGSPGGRGEAEGSGGGQELLLLADGMHQDS